MKLYAGAETIAAQIDAAFANVPFPSRVELVDGTMGWDQEYVLEHYGGKKRADLPERLTGCEGEDLCYMTWKGLHYYFPCFLKYLLSEAGATEESVMTQVLQLLNNDGESARTRWSMLTREQREAVIGWMAFKLELEKNEATYSLDDVERQKLEAVWQKWKLRLD